jgi:trans-aconitate methyltransferase
VKHNDYLFSTTGGRFTLLRQFEEMYRNCTDPHGQSGELERVDYHLVAAILSRVHARLEANGTLGRAVRVLDVGCGLGCFTAHIKGLLPTADVSGCDIAPTALSKAAARVPQCRFFPLDLKLPAAGGNETYEVLIALNVLCYFTEAELPEVMRNLRRLLATGGFLLVGYHLPKEMNFGRYIKSLDEARAVFEPHGFEFSLTLDVSNDFDQTYAGAPMGRHIYFLAQKRELK